MDVPAGHGVESTAEPIHLIPPEFMEPKYPPGAPPHGAPVQ